MVAIAFYVQPIVFLQNSQSILPDFTLFTFEQVIRYIKFNICNDL